MRTFDTATDTLLAIQTALTARDTEADAQVETIVRAILAAIKARGDAALIAYTRQFDWPQAAIDRLEISQEQCENTKTRLSPEEMQAPRLAAANIHAFHQAERERLHSWMQQGPQGSTLGQQLQPVTRVGIYVPGARAAYPSTVLMAAIPAIVAGVEEIILCTPPDQNGDVLPLVLACAADTVHKVFRIGGAQAIGAMAYGTETVPKCDVIVGPGNQYVNTAKKLVYGEVGLDMLAGPSEIAIIADEQANPAFVAADLLAQTEHGPENRGILFSPSAALLTRCQQELAAQRARLSRQGILAQTADHLLFIKTASVEEAIGLSNILAPEHLELMVREPQAILPLVRNAGAVLLGDFSSAPLGDYWAGPSHTLPTAGTARFSSPLSVATFMKRTSVISFTREAAAEAAENIARFAQAEGFDAHANAARLRIPAN